MAKIAIDRKRLTIRAACQAFTISETCYRYQPKLSNENAASSCASYIYATSEALAGTTNVFIGFTANWR
jgi:hypothetical protein